MLFAAEARIITANYAVIKRAICRIGRAGAPTKRESEQVRLCGPVYHAFTRGEFRQGPALPKSTNKVKIRLLSIF